MKKILLLIIALGAIVFNAMAARTAPASGRIVDQQGKAIEYATVVLLKDSTQVVGMATNQEGRFELKVPAGNYTLSVQFLGYDPLTQSIRIEEQTDLGDLVLKSSSTEIEGVVVKAQLIRREADRFVVDVANAPAAIGKDGIELLQHAPGVWIDGEKISINGKTGSKVYVNDRELRMNNEQLLTYLRTLRAEEIQKIEVVPTTGADYDADSSGGAIHITLKKRRENGLDGSISMRTQQADIIHNYQPSANINIRVGKVDAYASAWGYFSSQKMISNEQTRYTTGDSDLRSRSNLTDKNTNGGGSAGAVYTINDKHSIGGEFSFWNNSGNTANTSATDIKSTTAWTNTASKYNTRTIGSHYNTTFNYIWKIDSLGSTLKVLADYTRRNNDNRNNNFSRITEITPPSPVVDSTYRDISSNIYNVATATLALEKKFSAKWSLKAGAKYTYNDMANNALYQYYKQDAWIDNQKQSFTVDYIENIAAAYGILSANLGRWSMVAGLRAEYTSTYGKNGDVAQNYLSFFPNANISYSLTKDRAYSLIGQYARTIQRPNFWSLNPQRQQISDYTYQTGNPNLDPAFRQDMNLTLVMKYKYTLTAGMSLIKDEIQQTIIADPNDPRMLCLTTVNFETTKQFYLSANLPFQFTKWWTANLNATFVRFSQRIAPTSPEKYYSFGYVNASTTFTLPAKFFIDLGYNYQSLARVGTLEVLPQHRIEATLKKRFGEKFILSFSGRNLLSQPQKINAMGEGFVRQLEVKQPWNNRSYTVGLTYNFKSGKAFNRKSVEAGSAEEKSRM